MILFPHLFSLPIQTEEEDHLPYHTVDGESKDDMSQNTFPFFENEELQKVANGIHWLRSDKNQS